MKTILFSVLNLVVNEFAFLLVFFIAAAVAVLGHVVIKGSVGRGLFTGLLAGTSGALVAVSVARWLGNISDIHGVWFGCLSLFWPFVGNWNYFARIAHVVNDKSFNSQINFGPKIFRLHAAVMCVLQSCQYRFELSCLGYRKGYDETLIDDEVTTIAMERTMFYLLFRLGSTICG